METRKYLYGIIESDGKADLGMEGIGDNEVYAIHQGNVGAVVSDIGVSYEVEMAEAKTHEKVLRKIMETHAVIPMGFGVVARDGTEIENILKRARMKFRNTLAKLNGKIQINVKVSWDRQIFSAVLTESEEMRALTEKARKSVADRQLRIELGSKVKSALDERRDRYMKEVCGVLEGLADRVRQNRITGEYTVMNGAFLVDRRREKEFCEKTDELAEKYEKKLTFVSVGPLPPYDFTEMEIKRMDQKRVEEAREALGLGLEVTLSEIDSAYDLLAMEYHPDLHSQDPFIEEKFKKIKGAREILTEYCKHYLCSLERSKVDETLLVQEKAD